MRRKNGAKKSWRAWLTGTLATILIACFAASPVAAATSTVSLIWDANTEADLVGYKLYQASMTGVATCGPFTAVQTLGKVTTTSVTGLADGGYCWKLTARDATQESGFSNVVTFSADTMAPAAPSTLRVLSTVVVP